MPCIWERQKIGDAKLIDTMIKDGLWDAFNEYLGRHS